MKPVSKSLLALALGATLAGCGGGNGSSPLSPNPTSVPTAPIGKTATRAILASGYQSFHAAINYPYAGLQLALPASSPFREAKGQRVAKGALNATSPALFNPDLNLYQTVSTNANVTTIKFYTDAALTKAAGNSVLTAPNNQSVGGDYASYPAVVKITQNITAGNIPCQGSGSITFTGGSGANKLDGTLSLPKTGLKVTANLTLSDAGQVGGATTIVGNGQTITLSGLSGQLDGDLTGKANVLPDKTTGTGVVNVVTGKFQITLDTPQGTATGVGNPDGSLGIHFPDGLAETLASPFTVVGGQDPTEPTATATPSAKPTATPTAAPGTSVYNVPVEVQNSGSLGGFNNSDHVVTNSSGITFHSSPSANRLLPNSYNSSGAQNNVYASGLNNNDVTVGNDITSNTVPYFWTSPAAARQSLRVLADAPLTLALSLNDNGQVVGYEETSGNGDHARALAWNSLSATPTLLQNLTTNALNQNEAMSINAQGQIVGKDGAPRNTETPVYWSSTTAAPQALTRLDGQDPQLNTVAINAKGNVLTQSNSGVSAFYVSHTSQPMLLPYLSGIDPLGINRNDYGAASINSGGVVVGNSPFKSQGQTVGQHAVRWLTTGGQIKVQDLNTLIPANSGWELDQANFINDKGTIVGFGRHNGDFQLFLMTPR